MQTHISTKKAVFIKECNAFWLNEKEELMVAFVDENGFFYNEEASLAYITEEFSQKEHDIIVAALAYAE